MKGSALSPARPVSTREHLPESRGSRSSFENIIRITGNGTLECDQTTQQKFEQWFNENKMDIMLISGVDCLDFSGVDCLDLKFIEVASNDTSTVNFNNHVMKFFAIAFSGVTVR